MPIARFTPNSREDLGRFAVLAEAPTKHCRTCLDHSADTENGLPYSGSEKRFGETKYGRVWFN